MRDVWVPRSGPIPSCLMVLQIGNLGRKEKS